jgi:aspartyl aminopeptidase
LIALIKVLHQEHHELQQEGPVAVHLREHLQETEQHHIEVSTQLQIVFPVNRDPHLNHQEYQIFLLLLENNVNNQVEDIIAFLLIILKKNQLR